MLSFIEFGRRATGELYWGPPPSQEEASVGSRLEETIASHDIVVFSSGGCPFCSQAISELRTAGYSPTVIDCDPLLRQALAEKCGSRSVPKVFVKSHFVGGCNDGGMGGVVPLLHNGKLRELMES